MSASPVGTVKDQHSPAVRRAPLSSSHPVQNEMPIALVHNEPISVLPKDLYIPPEALMVILEAFSGPLDLLLYLIRRQNLDILDIPIAEITSQYMSYIAMMEQLDLEVAAEYMVMAAVLAEIKSRMLLPRPEAADEEEDPRAELVRRLQEYERFKIAAEDIDQLPRMERDLYPAYVEVPTIEPRTILPDLELQTLLVAFQEVLKRADILSSHHIYREPLSVRERMGTVLSRLQLGKFVEFKLLFAAEEGRRGMVVTFLAILELIKASLVDFTQVAPFAPLYLRPASETSSVATGDAMLSEFER